MIVFEVAGTAIYEDHSNSLILRRKALAHDSANAPERNFMCELWLRHFASLSPTKGNAIAVDAEHALLGIE
jgi:hypothetical protein